MTTVRAGRLVGTLLAVALTPAVSWAQSAPPPVYPPAQFAQQPPPPPAPGYPQQAPPYPQQPPAYPPQQPPAYPPQQPPAYPPQQPPAYPPQQPPAYPPQQPPDYPSQQPGYAPPAPAYSQQPPAYAPPSAAYPQQAPGYAPAPAAAAPAVGAAPSSTISTSAAPTDLWYRPTPADGFFPWNKHNPWGSWQTNDPVARSAWSATLTTSVHSFQSGLSGMGGEMGVRFGGAGLGVMLGTYLPGGSLLVGVDLLSNYGKILYDAYLPDVQVGILWPGIQARFINHSKAKVGSLVFPVFGARLTYEDFLKVDLRPLLGLWKGEAKDLAVSAGVSFDAGIAF
jgi:hypothetical protein